MKKRSCSRTWLILAAVTLLTVTGAVCCMRYALSHKPCTKLQKTNEQLYAQAVADTMKAEEDEIFPVVSLQKGEPYAEYNKDGQVLLFTFHRHPECYPQGKEVTLPHGEIWTFTGGELSDWFEKNSCYVTDWPLRLRQLIGLPPSNQSTHFTAMWVSPNNVIRPAYVQEIGDVKMTTSFSGDIDPAFKLWFDRTIIRSYFDGALPWTRLGYTYDWSGSGSEYGLSEFLVASGSKVTVAYTVDTQRFISMLSDGSWLIAASPVLSDAA